MCAGIFLIGIYLGKMFDGRPYNNSNVELVGMWFLVVGAMLGFNLGVRWILESLIRKIQQS